MPAGRPPKYKKEYAERAGKLALLGMTDKQLAGVFEVNEDTIYEWKNTYPEFSESLKKNREDADGEVVRSLYERAKGYKKKKDVEVNGQKITLEEEIPPDPTSMIFWLKNRQRHYWSDKQQIELSGQVGLVGLPGIDDEKV